MPKTSLASPRLALGVIALLSLTAACSSSTENTENPSAGGGSGAGGSGAAAGSGGAGGSAGSAGSAGDAGSAGSAGASGSAGSAGMTMGPQCDAALKTNQLTGKSGRTNPNSAKGVSAQACLELTDKTKLCLAPVPVENGEFSVAVPEMAQCIAHSVARIWSDAAHAPLYCEMDLSNKPVGTLAAAAILPSTQPATNLPDKGDTAQARTVTFASGATLEITPGQLFTEFGDYADLADVRIAGTESAPCMADKLPGNGQYFGFAPEGNAKQDVPFSFPAEPENKPGDVLDVYVLGNIFCATSEGDIIPEGTWQKIGQAEVNAQSQLVPIAPLVGLPCLSWVSFRKPQ